ncbi:MAG TPA: glucosamine-6-phosphate deaminase [Amycolatopsis sp.]|nr:glucosamine-6-phosphate deaminase [Amycolatopsis sp.]
MPEVTIRETFEPTVRSFPDPEALGVAAARDIGDALVRRLESQPGVRMIFASAPSQEATLRHLATRPGIDWSRVTAFHMDEYLGLAPDAPQRFGNWLSSVLLDRVPIGAAHLIDPGPEPGGPTGPTAAVESYAALLAAAPIDILCLGIGVNGHLAFNDPPADFADPALVKLVTLDEVSRIQQVDDGCFTTLDEVPGQALTLTIPALLSAAEAFCMVPGAQKKRAVTAALYGPIDGSLPASALRTHPRCTLYVDKESAPDAD